MVCKCDQLPHLCCKSEVANSIDVHSQYQLQTKRDIHVNPLCGAEIGHMVCSSLGTNQPMKTRLQSCQLIQGRVKQLQVSHSDPEDTVWSSLSSLKSEDSVETWVKSCSHSRVDSLTSVCDLSVFLSLLQAVNVKTGMLTSCKAQLTFIRTSQRRRSTNTQGSTHRHTCLTNCS